MKPQIGIWIDSSRAVLVRLTPKSTFVEELKSNVESASHHEDEGQPGTFMGSAHINNEHTFEERKRHQIDSFLKNVVNELSDADQIFVFGPGKTKSLLSKKIHDNRELASHLAEVRPADKMTENQVVANVKGFFHYPD